MKNNKLFIPIILGTGRQGRYSEKVADYVFEQTKNESFDCKIIDVKKYATPVTVPPWQENKISKKLSAIIKKADGIIIVIPEYNRGYPGELKIFIDKLGHELENKPVAFCGVSSGKFGGARAIENILPIIVYMGAHPINQAVYFSLVEKLFTKKGVIKDSTYHKKIKKLFETLLAQIK